MLDLKRILFIRALLEADQEARLLNDACWQSLKLKKLAEPMARLDALCMAVEDLLTHKFRLDLPPYYAELALPGRGILLVLCFLMGMGSNYLGEKAAVNLLLNPFLLLLFWNFAIFAVAIIPKSLKQKFYRGDGFGSRLERLWLYLLMKPQSSQKLILLKARLNFQKLLFQIQKDRAKARYSSWLHLAAIALSLGVIAGLYFQGLIREYHFTWESTFIKEPEILEQLLQPLFAPVLFLGSLWLENQLPPLEGANGSAWIHLYATAAFFYIILPRSALFLFQWKKAQVPLPQELDLRDHYFIELLSHTKGNSSEMMLWGYAFQVDEARLPQLKAAGERAIGEYFANVKQAQIAWGEVDVETADQSGLWVVCFNGAQTPEEEVHQMLAKNMLNRAVAQGTSLLFVVDASKVEADRQDHKQKTWASVLGTQMLWLNCLSEQTPTERPPLATKESQS